MHRHTGLEIARHLFDAGVLLMAGTDTFGFPSISPGIAFNAW